jgi:carbonic anhydrase/SulP family sulfate permease
LLGHDTDPEGEMSFFQPDRENTLSELYATLYDLQLGAAVVGISGLLFLFAWDRIPRLKKSIVPAPLIVVVWGVCFQWLMHRLAAGVASESILSSLTIENSHLVQVPVAERLSDLQSLLVQPAWTRWLDPQIYVAGATLALVSSLETLLNLEAVDKLDPGQRSSPPNRELIAQGIGNIASGCCGGLPVTSVIIRSSVNINAGATSRFSAIAHGVLLLACVALIPRLLNMIPLSALAAILLHTGIKLASPRLVRDMYQGGWSQFLPFLTTVIAIVFTDLLIGIVIGMVVSIAFILAYNLRQPVHRVLEKHAGGDLLRIELPEQLTFLNRAALMRTLDQVQRGTQLLIDARRTDYIDPDVLDSIEDYQERTAPARGVKLSLTGFQNRYRLDDRLHYVDYSTREMQALLTPDQAIEYLRAGNERFLHGQRLTRDIVRQVSATAEGQFPIAVVLSCIDSRTPAELIFDLGLGDIFSVRIAGNVAREKVFGSMEYSCAVAGAKLVLVLGHSRCGAVTAAVDLLRKGKRAIEATGCEHLDALVTEIQQSVQAEKLPLDYQLQGPQWEAFVDAVALANVQRTVRLVHQRSRTLARLADEGQIAITGGFYDIRTGAVQFLDAPRFPPSSPEESLLRNA